MNTSREWLHKCELTDLLLATPFELDGVVFIPIVKRILLTDSCTVVQPSAITYTRLNRLEDRDRDGVVDSF